LNSSNSAPPIGEREGGKERVKDGCDRRQKDGRQKKEEEEIAQSDGEIE
jgi:hypothetical protein